MKQHSSKETKESCTQTENDEGGSSGFTVTKHSDGKVEKIKNNECIDQSMQTV